LKVRFASQPNRLHQLTLPAIATAEDLDRVIGVNLRGTFLCYKYAGLQMIAQGRGGRIIGKQHVPLRIMGNSLRPGLIPYRCMLGHGQAGTGVSERLLCEQIRNQGFDSVRWCVRSTLFPGSGAVRMLKRFPVKFSFGVRRTPHYREFLCSRTRQDTNVYAPSLSCKDTFLTRIRG
jgi:hypothetical protein